MLHALKTFDCSSHIFCTLQKHCAMCEEYEEKKTIFLFSFLFGFCVSIRAAVQSTTLQIKKYTYCLQSQCNWPKSTKMKLVYSFKSLFFIFFPPSFSGSLCSYILPHICVSLCATTLEAATKENQIFTFFETHSSELFLSFLYLFFVCCLVVNGKKNQDEDLTRHTYTHKLSIGIQTTGHSSFALCKYYNDYLSCIFVFNFTTKCSTIFRFCIFKRFRI